MWLLTVTGLSAHYQGCDLCTKWAGQPKTARLLLLTYIFTIHFVVFLRFSFGILLDLICSCWWGFVITKLFGHWGQVWWKIQPWLLKRQQMPRGQISASSFWWQIWCVGYRNAMKMPWNAEMSLIFSHFFYKNNVMTWCCHQVARTWRRELCVPFPWRSTTSRCTSLLSGDHARQGR